MKRYIARRLAAAEADLKHAQRAAYLLIATPYSSHADGGVRAARRRLDRWLVIAELLGAKEVMA